MAVVRGKCDRCQRSGSLQSIHTQGQWQRLCAVCVEEVLRLLTQPRQVVKKN